MYFTFQERTVKNKTVGQAVEQASKVLFVMHNIKEVCMNAVSRADLKTEITTEQMSRIVEKIVDDSIYYKL